ncbi:hypothetical protein Tco_0544347, partial [Tanacetum coccineum]
TNFFSTVDIIKSYKDLFLTKLKGIQNLSPAEQEAADIMKALKDSRRMLGRQPGTGGSDEGTGEIPGVPDESIYADAEDDKLETES